MRRLMIAAAFLALACVPLMTTGARPRGAAGAGSGQAATTPPAEGRQRGGGGRADAPMVGPGNLITGVWGADPFAVDSRGWGWMTRSYVSASYKRQAPTEDLSKDPEKKIADSQNKQGVAAGQAAANL